MGKKNYVGFLFAFLGLALISSTGIAVYYRFKWQDQRVLTCHLMVNDAFCLATNGVNTLASTKDRQLWYYYQEFNSSLSRHPGRDYFLWKIRKCTEEAAAGMRERGILTEAEITELLSITNEPQGSRTYRFDM